MRLTFQSHYHQLREKRFSMPKKADKSATGIRVALDTSNLLENVLMRLAFPVAIRTISLHSIVVSFVREAALIALSSRHKSYTYRIKFPEAIH